MRSLVTLLLASLVAVSGQVPVPFTECASNGLYQIESVTASYWPPQLGGPAVNVTQVVNLKEAVTSGSWKTTSKLFGITVDSQSGGVCDGTYGDFKCPAPAGQVTVQSAIVPPASSPLHGDLTSIAQISINGADVAGCWQVVFKV